MDYVPVDYFEVAMEHVFHWEGGYVNDPRDAVVKRSTESPSEHTLRLTSRI